MILNDLGYNLELNKFRKANGFDSFGIARVVSEYKERYIVKTDKNEYEAEIVGKLRFSAKNRSDFPAVGDWVAISEYDDHKVLIHNIFPRRTIIERQAVGKIGEKQIIATNIDDAFIVQAVDRDFNINRIERYITICTTSRVNPIIVLNKIDLISDPQLKNILDSVKERIKTIPVVAISNKTQIGYEKILNFISRGRTYCLLGSSGVGKSTLLNNIAGKEQMKTNTISLSTRKGRHVTSHRELIVVENGGILIDNPGMREVGIADATKGLEITFDVIVELSRNCKYKNCTHTHEKGCSILEAIERNEIDKDSYENYMKMEREKRHFELSVEEKRKKDKDLGKMIKSVKKFKKHYKY